MWHVCVTHFKRDFKNKGKRARSKIMQTWRLKVRACFHYFRGRSCETHYKEKPIFNRFGIAISVLNGSVIWRRNALCLQNSGFFNNDIFKRYRCKGWQAFCMGNRIKGNVYTFHAFYGEMSLSLARWRAENDDPNRNRFIFIQASYHSLCRHPIMKGVCSTSCQWEATCRVIVTPALTLQFSQESLSFYRTC